ncbi:NAD(P)-binding protein [Violaceomyces palustris]|uniref:NAD(P)-binding protein n=1 Tax=Violaceomyces palustris TaxID=1673888 RepID=A0ACD0NLJ9_9BASI|nr:NAD(P)-binding protein [Violaceomyces palustris]
MEEGRIPTSHPMPLDFQQLPLAGKKAIVTGSSSVVGASLARSLALQGASVILGFQVSNGSRGGGDQESNVEGKVKEILNDPLFPLHLLPRPPTIVALEGDFRSVPTCRSFAKRAMESLQGELDILILNLGLADTSRSIREMTESDFDLHFDSNAKVPLFLLQSLEPHIRPDGRIVFFSTTLTSNPTAVQPGQLNHVASKGAVEQMVRVLSRDPELSSPNRRITVNAISPDPVLVSTNTATTATTSEFSPFLVTSSRDVQIGSDGGFRPGAPHPLPTQPPPTPTQTKARIEQLEEISKAVCFLASPNSGWVTGQNLRVHSRSSSS